MSDLGTKTLIIAAFALTACDASESTEIVTGQLSRLDQRVTDLEGIHERQTADAVLLRPTDNGFSYLASDLGPIRISIKDVKAIGNGSQVTFLIGNPTSATFTEIESQISWGTGDDIEDLLAKHSMTFSSAQELGPSTYREYKVNLASVPPSKLAWIRIGRLEVNRMSLEHYADA